MNLWALLQSNLYRLSKDVRGQDLIEYALMTGLSRLPPAFSCLAWLRALARFSPKSGA
jgi:hypothetical protein